jgi:hypothetical protein
MKCHREPLKNGRHGPQNGKPNLLHLGRVDWADCMYAWDAAAWSIGSRARDLDHTPEAVEVLAAQIGRLKELSLNTI